jgi:hypothetical protein
MPKLPASRYLTLVTSLARCPTEHSIKVLAGIMSNEDAPPMAEVLREAVS